MKKLSRICTVLMAVVIGLSLGINVFATGSVIYDGRANEFIFEPGSDYAPTDLFSGFKNVMPGDALTEQIVIENKTSNRFKVKVYMRSLGAQDETDDFLSQMKLTVKPVNKTKLFEAPADETAQLTQWVHLGTLRSGGKITLDVTLEVPITMGNDYQNQIGYLDWEFKVEEIPVDPDTPGTGDTNDIVLYGILLAVSVAGMWILLLLKRKKQTRED